jgi:hypothetical protein
MAGVWQGSSFDKGGSGRQLLLEDNFRRGLVQDIVEGDDAAADIAPGRDFKHDVKHDFFQNGYEAARSGVESQCLAG